VCSPNSGARRRILAGVSESATGKPGTFDAADDWVVEPCDIFVRKNLGIVCQICGGVDDADGHVALGEQMGHPLVSRFRCEYVIEERDTCPGVLTAADVVGKARVAGERLGTTERVDEVPPVRIRLNHGHGNPLAVGTLVDELSDGFAVVPYDERWPDAFIALAGRIEGAFGSLALKVDHIGSTSVPGLAAKDCIDLQVRVETIEENSIIQLFENIGFRVRPEEWNHIETSGGVTWPKLVFAPPIGERACNIHVRQAASATTRRNLLFRDFLRANDVARDAWGSFKQQLAMIGKDIYEYGQIKAGPTEILMIAAESWATDAGWVVS
jgi:GrpB-like predicted nucleotidyltransferase (UPF0157 family)